MKPKKVYTRKKTEKELIDMTPTKYPPTYRKYTRPLTRKKVSK